MLLFLLARAVTQSAGYLYPAYASYKALKTRNARELVQWLEYWAVLGVFTLVEFFTDIFLFWFPFYYLIKALFVLWLALPMTKGSRYIYRSLLHPTLERHEREIDEALQQAQASAITTSSSWGRQAMQAIQKAAVESFSRASLGDADNAKVTMLETSVAVRTADPQTDGGGTSRVAALASAAANMFAVLSSPASVSEVPSPRLNSKEHQIRAQRNTLQKMMEQLDQAERELVHRRQHQSHRGLPPTPLAPHPPSSPHPSSGAAPASSAPSRPRHRSRKDEDEAERVRSQKQRHGRHTRRSISDNSMELSPSAQSPGQDASTSGWPSSEMWEISPSKLDSEGGIREEDMLFSAGELDDLMKAVKGRH